MIDIIRKNWFLIGIVLVIITARIEPSIGLKGGRKFGRVRVCCTYVGLSRVCRFVKSARHRETDDVIKRVGDVDLIT
jgi:hypothetical protein